MFAKAEIGFIALDVKYKHILVSLRLYMHERRFPSTKCPSIEGQAHLVSVFLFENEFLEIVITAQLQRGGVNRS